MLTLYSGPLSLFARKTEIALAEKGLAYDRVMVDFTQERGYQPKHPKVLAHNPKGQVPVLIDGNLALFDSTLIFEYLEDAYPTPPLLPAAPKERARVRLLELLADEVVLVREVRPLMTRTVPPAADLARRAAETEAALQAEALLERRHGDLQARLGGRTFSAATSSPPPISRSSWCCSSSGACTDPRSRAIPSWPPGTSASPRGPRSRRSRRRSPRPTAGSPMPGHGDSTASMH